LVVHLESDEGVISIKRPGGTGEEFCSYDRKLCPAKKNDQVKLIAKANVKTVGKFKCTWSAERVSKELSRLDFDFEDVPSSTTSAWTHVESKPSKPKPPATVPTAAVSSGIPEEHKSTKMIFNQVGTVLEDFGWKAVIGFSYNGVEQRALLVSKKHDPPVDNLAGYLGKGDLVDFDAHEYFRKDGTDNVTWYVSRAKRVPDTLHTSEGEPVVKCLVGVTATVVNVDDVNSSGILELLASSPRGNKVYFESRVVFVDKRLISVDLQPLSAHISVGDVVKINARPACESDPLDFPWVAERVLRETRYFSAAVSAPTTSEVNNNNNTKSSSPSPNLVRVAEELRDFDDELDWGDEDDKRE
jgi:hypothetical protein